jgi:hypothetical protein
MITKERIAKDLGCDIDDFELWQVKQVNSNIYNLKEVNPHTFKFNLTFEDEISINIPYNYKIVNIKKLKNLYLEIIATIS